MMPTPGPFIEAELDYRREHIAKDFAAANMRRRFRTARRDARRRHAYQRSHRNTTLIVSPH